MSNRQHNDSMSEQGNFQYADITGSQPLRVDSGTTNIRVSGSSTPIITQFKTPFRTGRKIRVFAASDTAASVVINDVSGHIVTASGTLTLAANEYADFICTPQASGASPVWLATSTNGTDS